MALNNRAVVLIDDHIWQRVFGMMSAWDYNPGSQPQPVQKNMKMCSDGKNPSEKAFIRDVNPVSGCKVGLELTIESECDSYFIKFYDGENEVWTIRPKDGYLYFNDTKTNIKAEHREYGFYTETDLENGYTVLYADDEYIGKFDTSSGSFTKLKIGIDSFTEGSLDVVQTFCFANYGICDMCKGITTKKVSDKWQPDENSTFFKEKYFGENCWFTYKLSSEKGLASVVRPFDKTGGKICFEVKYHSLGENDKTVFALLGNGKEIISVTDESTLISCMGKNLRKRHENVWQTLRIEVDTEKKSAVIKVNGKVYGTFELDECEPFADLIKISYEGDKTLLFTDIFVFEMPDDSDYVPEPVLPQKKDYTVGINVCSLWRNGHHGGWDLITPFDDIQTYLGTYDEGLSETADWETKWLAEHGIDFGLFCWYNNEINAPLFKTGLSFALEDGYFNSKYSDKMKFAILWEALNCARAGEEGFRNHIVPYWLDHFLCDDRYMTIDNKPVISIFGLDNLINDFGSREGVKKQFDYVREKAREIGYDGVYFIACAFSYEGVKDCGVDAIHVYSWGHNGYKKEFTKFGIQSQMNTGPVHVLPTISTGFNEIAWNGTRYPQLKCEDMRELISWVKSDILPKYTSGRQLDRTVMFSTWNEFGEGTYMMPSTLCGFGYLDEIRRGFTEDEPHEDVVPTDAQLERIGVLFPRGRSRLRNHQLAECGDKSSEKIIPLELTPESWTITEGVDVEYLSNGIKGKSNVFDPQMIYKSELPVVASVIKQIKIKMRAEKDGAGDYVFLHFLTDCEGGENWDMAKSFAIEASNEKVKEYVVNTDNNSLWNGNITAFRIDPLGAEGVFEMESVELVCDESRAILRIDGKCHKTTVPTVILDDGVFVPVDSASAMNFGALCKWNRISEELYLEFQNKTLKLKKGSDEAFIDGEKVQMSRPLEFFDGLPMISLDIIFRAFGGSYTVDGKYVNVSLAK